MMWGMSWYRQYRPQTVAALHIAPVREAFQRILNLGEYSHAYLLTGPKGTGKTSGARILAKVLNCEGNRDAVEILLKGKQKKKAISLKEPCNVCAACSAITQGSSFCVLEMDGASNRGIDDIRELTAKVGLSPGDGLVNVVIIDEVHMLTTEAFNALLKVLEEPPAHVVFILATTDMQKMPQTVVSRCQVIAYRKAASEEIIQALTAIAEAENLTVDTEVLSSIVAYADGSFRDAVKAFEQIGKGKTKVTAADVVLVLGQSVRELSEDLLKHLGKRDGAGVAALFSKMSTDGTDLLTVQKEVLRSLHERMVSAHLTGNPHLPTYVALLKSLNLPPAPSLPYPGIPFEIACLEWCLPKAVPSPATTRSRVRAVGPKVDVSVPSEATLTPQPRKKKDLIEDEREPEPLKEEIEPEGPPVEYTLVVNRWHEVLRGVRDKNPSVEALLRTTKPQKMENNVLSLEVFYKFHKEQLETARNYSIIHEVLNQLFASRIKPVFVMGEKAIQAAELPESNLSGVVDLTFVKAAEEAFLS